MDCHEHIALEVRHAMMNKYRGPSDGNFKLVSGRIKEIFQKVQAIRILTKEELGYIQSLSSNYREHKDRNPKRVPGTCSWFLEHPIFRKWRDEGTENLLLVSADPGCGKSVLSRALVDERLVTSDEPTATTDVICYFFFKDDDTDRRSAAAALCALLHQLFKQRPTLLKHAMTDFEYHGDKIRGMFQTMWDILVKVAADPDAGRIICVLDALDECEESARQALIQELSGFHRARHGMKTQLKFLITSRPYSEIRGEFGSEVHDLPSISVKGEEESESISEEINLVITEEVTRIARARDPPINKELLDELVKRLKGMENRTYLWLHLILDEIRRSLESSPGKLGKLLQKISPSINAAYERILNRVPESNKIEAKRLLNIVVSAERPLTLEETNIALAIIEKKENVDKCDSENDLELDSQDAFILKVRNLCGLFINIVDSKVYLIHLTAREFLIRADRIHQHSIPAGAEASTWKVELDHSHFLMANICISYLLFPTFETCPNNVDEYCNEHALLKYAAMHWADHYRQAKVRGKTTLLESTINVCNHQSSQFRTWVQVYKHNLSYYTYFPDSANLLVGSYFGLEAVVERLLEKGADVALKDKEGRTALYSAAWNGHEAVVETLLQKGADVALKDKYGQTALYLAAQNGHEAVVEKLLQKGADVTLKDEDGQTALHSAAWNGHEAVVEALLQKGADVALKDKYRRTALHLAAQGKHEVVVKLLLDKGTDLESKDNSGQTTVSWAAENGHETVVKLLLDKGAEKSK